MAKFSVAWKAHNQNICSGLTSLQQNGEFVDMTLAADGHHVKVHQMVISLASPYLKEIITSIENPHPVIFLMNISYPVLSALLEYIYTGEVVIEQDDLEKVMKAAQELQIKGLEDVKYELQTEESSAISVVSRSRSGQLHPKHNSTNQKQSVTPSSLNRKQKEVPADQAMQQFYEGEDFSDMNEEVMQCTDSDMEGNHGLAIRTPSQINDQITDSTGKKVPKPQLQLQYTLSNMGSVQLILNRYMYSVRYTSVKGPDGHRLWRCVDFVKGKCRAGVVTRDGVVVRRFSVHNHPFHDHRILKKVRNGLVFSAIKEAETVSKNKGKSTPHSDSKS